MIDTIDIDFINLIKVSLRLIKKGRKNSHKKEMKDD